MTDPRNWVLGCPECHADILIVNAAPTRKGPICPNCEDFETHEFFEEGLVALELGWCGCGDPSRVDEMMVSYLTGESDEDGAKWPRLIGTDADLLIAYLADNLGWTEHGGSVYGAWITDAGREALKNLRGALSE